MIQPTLTNLHPNEYSQELHYYLFAVNLDRSAESCNTLEYYMQNIMCPKKILLEILLHEVAKNGKYSGNIICDSVVTRNEIITKPAPTKCTSTITVPLKCKMYINKF